MSARITRRPAKKGSRYLVYYRLGGRGSREYYAGSFRTEREAKIRRDVVAGEIAAGRDPQTLLDQLRKPAARPRGLEERWDAFAASRLDVSPKTLKQYRNARDRWVPILGATRDPATITVDDLIAGVATLADELAANTVGVYFASLAQVFDFCDIHPNPCRSKKIRLPQAERGEKAIPSNEAWREIVKHIKKRSRLAIRVQECLGLRVSEACLLEYGDIDLVDGAVRVRRETTKTGAGRRWIPCPDVLLDEVAARVHPDDRSPSMLALGVKPSEVAYDLDQACIRAGLPEFGTHALRHRRISLWLRHGVDPVQVSRWSGHAKPSESLDTYGHVVLDPAGDEWGPFWRSIYARHEREEVEA